jgi:serine/threonine protein kinase/Tfp pilus assembly protein PilF
MRLERGSKLGPYEILSPIGAGGMGEVYRARDLQLGRDIAIKVLPQEVSADEERLARFENEARLASSLNHPNIITIHSMGWQNQRCYIAMELIEGQTLEELMEKGPVPVEQALNIAAQVADGLAKAHEAGIIHRDLKPKNVMITKDGHAKILDFGLSKLMRPTVDSEAPTASGVETAKPFEGLTLPGTILGTIEYMSPEQAAGRFVDYRSDQFSMGSLMYAILTGSRPFHRESAVQTLNQIIEGEPRPVDELNPRVPAALQAVVRRCLMKSPRDRYKSTQDLARELQQLELDRKMLLRRWTRRDWIRASIGLLILLVVVGSIWIWSRMPYRPKPAAVEWYKKGMTAMHSMAFDSARKAFDLTVEADPKFALAQASLARAYEEMGYSEQAKEQMLRAMEVEQQINLSSKDTKRFRILQYMVSHQYDNAVPLLQQLEQDADKQDRPAAALECGWLAEKQYDTEGAAAAYERALQMNPGYAAAHLRLGYIRQRRGEDELALGSFTKAETLYRTSSDSEGITETLYQRASFLNRRSRAAEAMESIDQAIALAHAIENRYQEIRLQLLQSAVVRKLGDNARASESAQQAIDAALKENMDNLAASGRLALGNVFFNSGDYESAEKNYRDARNIAQRGKVRHYEALASLSLGSLFEQKNQPEQSREFVEEAMPFFKEAGYRRESIQAITILGRVLCELGAYEEGIEVLREALPKAIQLHDSATEAQIRQRLVELLQAQGNWPEALRESELSVNLLSSPTEGAYARLNCADLYWRLGRWQKAEQSLAEIELLLGNNEDPLSLFLLRLRQAEMAYAEGRFEEAKAYARKAISAVPASVNQAEPDARLIEVLVSIRTGHRNEGIQSALKLVREFEESRLAGNAASARLAIAEALVDTEESSRARDLARDALQFFEQHNVLESIWRAHLVAARVSERSADISAHRNSARSALAQMRNLWPSSDVDNYLQRADIRLLSGNLDF